MNQDKIGKFISKLRKDKNITQEQLAEKLGVTSKSISRWENGRTMPDVSLFEPLCTELGITINELLSGEKINKKDYQDKFEENILNTINYSNEKLEKSRNIIGIFLLIFGFLVTLTSLVIFPSESSFSSIYSVLGSIISLIGFAKLTRKINYSRRIFLNYGFLILFSTFLFILDFINVKLNNEAPMFSKETITIDTTIYYDTPFYDVFRCNTNLKNEYWVIESNKTYNEESIIKYCK
ncbi:MAG: helix-turn-helix transcriptional regulator [Bacilli bacterium]|nr:helix-turn-helix transcriptional regulator [bacterium]MBQ9853656.1 helix-turn-helix transcriptional regulator [Bacilli bacterium]